MATVSELIDTQVARGNTLLAQEQGFINDLRALLEIDTVIRPSIEIPAVPGFEAPTWLINARALAPVYGGSTSIEPAVSPEAPSLTFSDIDTVQVEDFDKAPPTLAFPETPSAVLPSSPAAVTVQDVPLPVAPVLSFPTAPVVGTIVLPDMPSIEIPTYDTSAPQESLLAPSAEFSWAEQAYSSAIQDELKAKLLNDLENGGYGIEPGDEAALWERQRDRVTQAGLAAQAQIEREFASRGYPMPPGAQVAAVQAAMNESLAKLSETNRDIALQRSALYVQNRQFTIAQAKELESLLMGYHGAMQERALNAARSTVEFAVAIFDASVRKFNAQLAAWQAGAQVFEARIRAAAQQADIYRTQVQAKGVEADIQKTQVDNYRAQLDGVNALVNVYRTQMEAARTQADIERLKMDSFRAAIDAYVAQVRAKESEFGLYKAAIDGETAKVNAYEAEVRAYVAKVEGSKAKSDVMLGRLRAETEQATAKLRVFEGEIAQYRAQVDARAQEVGANNDIFRAYISSYQAALGAMGEGYRIQQQATDMTARADRDRVAIATEQVRADMQTLMSLHTLRTNVTQQSTQMFAQQISAIFNSIMTLASQSTAE